MSEQEGPSNYQIAIFILILIVAFVSYQIGRHNGYREGKIDGFVETIREMAEDRRSEVQLDTFRETERNRLRELEELER